MKHKFHQLISKCKNRLKASIIAIISTNFGGNSMLKNRNDEEYKDIDTLKNFIKDNTSCDVIDLEYIKVDSNSDYKWVGGVCTRGYDLIGIPNGATNVLEYNIGDKKICYWGDLPKDNFKWTGGGEYKGNIYGFLRTSNELLRINIKSKKTYTINLNLNYNAEHHYGGVITNEGIIYQPPRNEDHILAIDLNTYKAEYIQLAPKWMNLKMRYCGSVLHPNGYIYFLPERGQKVIKFDPNTQQFEYIGDLLDCMVFDAAIAEDGNIYGFSAYSKGILRIDVKNDITEIICEDLTTACYGTKLGINGKIYGIPGDGDKFLEFDIVSKKLRIIGETKETVKAKCAGGIVDKYGDIYAIPAYGNYIYKLKFSNNKKIPKEVYNKFFCDYY